MNPLDSSIPTVAVLIGACGGSGADLDPSNHHQIQEPIVNFDFDHSATTDTFSRSLTIALDNDCRITLAHFTDTEDMTWWATCSEQEKQRVRALSTEARVNLYLEESEPFGEVSDPLCKFAFFLPPDKLQYTVRYAAEGAYSAESQELIAFFSQLYESHPPE